MKFQRSTVILVGVALVLGAGVLIVESQRGSNSETAEVTEDNQPIFGFAETDVATLTVEREGETLVLEGDGEGNWQMTQHATSVAEPGAVAFLLSRLNTDAPLQTVTMAADQIADFGLDNPQGQVTVVLQNGTEHTLLLGGPDFSGNANYAIIDPTEDWPPTAPTGDYEVLVVTRDVANGINRPLDEWKMPVEGATEESPEAEAAPDSDSETDPENTPAEAN